MSCPYDETLLDYWDGVCNPMGDDCYECEEWGCDHNFNFDNPNFVNDCLRSVAASSPEKEK